MKIGIDCRAIVNPAFSESVLVGHYALCLVEALLRQDQANRYVLYVDRELNDDAIREITHGAVNAEVRRFPFHEFRSWMPGVYAKAFLPALYAKDRLDVLFEPSAETISAFRGKQVVAIHDAYRLTEDAHRSERIVVPSEFVKHELEKKKIDAKKIDVIPYGVMSRAIDDGFDAREKFGLSDKYIFFLGTINTRKNIHALMRAFVRLTKEHPNECANLSLVLAGAKGEGSDQIFAELDASNDEIEAAIGRRAIRYIGYVTLHEKWDLLERATLFAYPALKEGFGLPVLEAMSVGAPVIASNREGLPELVGSAGLLIDPEYTNDLYLGMSRLLLNESDRQHFIEAGKKQASKYTWEKTAKDVLNSLHKAMMG